MEFSKALFIGHSHSGSATVPQWAFSGGFITGTYWSGAVQFSTTQGIPIASNQPEDAAYASQPHFGSAVDPTAFTPIRAWQSEDRGFVVDMAWAPKHKKLIVGCEDGSIVQISPLRAQESETQNFKAEDDDAMETDGESAQTKVIKEDDNPRDEDHQHEPKAKRAKKSNTNDTNGDGMDDDREENVEVDGTVIYRHAHPVEAVVCSNIESSTNLWVASANSIGQIALLDLNFADETSQALTQWAHCARVTALAMSQNVISSAASDGSLTLWDARLKLHAAQIGSNRDGLKRDYSNNGDDFTLGTCTSLQFGANGSENLFVGNSTGSVFLYDLRRTHHPVMQFKEGSSAVRSLAPNPKNPAIVAFGSDDHSMRIIDFTISPVSSASATVVSGARMSVVGDAARQNAANEDIPTAKLHYKYIHGDKVRGVAWKGDSGNEIVSAGWDRIVVRHNVPNM